ncbi:hypothetical protein BMR86_23075, partial [Stenotrophomonas sp. KAs 5-3]
TPECADLRAWQPARHLVGEVRADLYWGSGDAAGKLAGDMKQKGNIWMLWPKGVPLPN